MDNTFDKIYYPEGELIAGVDESGVSDIAGPLVAACVILPKIEDIKKHNLKIFEINDSKKVPEKYRDKHIGVIYDVALAIGIGEVTAPEIDILGKQASTRLAMARAVMACRDPGERKTIPDFILYDAADFGTLPLKIKQKGIPGGDEKSLCIAAASLVAKAWRDSIMLKLHERFPQYGWLNNKGYPCENHFKGLDQNGVIEGVHRIKRWPFISNNKETEGKTVWNKRRRLWRQRTEARYIKEAAGPVTKSKNP